MKSITGAMVMFAIGRTMAAVIDATSGGAAVGVAPLTAEVDRQGGGGSLMMMVPHAGLGSQVGHPPPPHQMAPPHPPTPTPPHGPHRKTTRKPDFGILTQDPQTASYIVLMNAIVLSIVILFIWLPSFILLAFQIGVQRRSSDTSGTIPPIWEWDDSSLLSRLALLRDIWNKLDSSNPACRQRVVCEIHQYQSHIGTLPRLLLTTLDNAVDVCLSLVPPHRANELLREYGEAKGAGETELDSCRKYSSCPYSIAQYMKYPGLSPADI